MQGGTGWDGVGCAHIEHPGELGVVLDLLELDRPQAELAELLVFLSILGLIQVVKRWLLLWRLGLKLGTLLVVVAMATDAAP